MSRRECTIRPLNISLSEIELFREWIHANRDKNGLDEEMLRYPATTVLVADGGDSKHPWLMVPIHPAYIMDSLAPNPDASMAQVGLALRKMTEIVKWEGRRLGHGEVWFVASEPSIAEFAAKHERFVEVKARVFKLKIDEV
jgi:hypothetical protein